MFSVFNGSKDNLQRHLLGPVLHHSSTDKSLTGVSSIMLQSVSCLMRRGFFFDIQSSERIPEVARGRLHSLGSSPSALIHTPFSVVDDEVSSRASVG